MQYRLGLGSSFLVVGTAPKLATITFPCRVRVRPLSCLSSVPCKRYIILMACDVMLRARPLRTVPLPPPRIVLPLSLTFRPISPRPRRRRPALHIPQAMMIAMGSVLKCNSAVGFEQIELALAPSSPRARKIVRCW